MTVTTSIVYNVGSRHERTGETGLAHMLEHMLFKPTSGTGVKWKDLENKGAHLNATTWLDRTLYYFTLPREYLGDMLHVEADRMRNTLFTDKEFAPERTNVLSEYEIQNSTPEEVLAWHIIGAAFENHGYHHDTIGFRHDIENYSVNDLKSFYDRHYWPNNATLIVAGDIPERTLSEVVIGAFKDLPSHEVDTSTTRIEAPQEGVRRATLVRNTPLRAYTITWKAPAFTHPDWAPLMLALNYLSDGETSPLYKALIETHMATDVGAHIYPTHDPYLAYLTIRATEKTRYETIEKTILKVLESETRRQPTEKVLAPHRESALAQEAKERDGSRAVALTLSEYVASGDWKRYVTFENELGAVTGADVLRVMREYLVIDRATIGTIEHKK